MSQYKISLVHCTTNNVNFCPRSKPKYCAHFTRKSLLPISAVQLTNAPEEKEAKVLEASIPEKWTARSWRKKRAHQLPDYPNACELDSVLKTIESFPPLVLGEEAIRLEEKLADAASGRAFVLQGGDCAETFKEFSAEKTRDTFKLLLQMSLVLMYGAHVPIIKVGRMAGQFAKARSSPIEERDGVKLPVYRGDIINGEAFDEMSRIPDPQRLIRAYCQSAATLNMLRSFSTAGYADIQKVADWNLDCVENRGSHERYHEMARYVDEALGFMEAIGFAGEDPTMTRTDVWTAHECLHLPYEEALTRMDPISGLSYDCSAHMLWCGERTRQLDGAHVEFLRGISNPIGIKVNEKMNPNELTMLVEKLNPGNKAGRITIMTRMGEESVRAKLPNLIREVRRAGQVVTWLCDPMQANTIRAPCGLKTRSFDAILGEIRAFFDAHEEEGSYPGGIHLEMIGQNVTECIGESGGITYQDLGCRYYTNSDPRLNDLQSLELAFLVSQRFRPPRISSNY